MKALLTILLSTSLYADTCTYNTWEWHVKQKRSMNHRIVKKSRSELTEAEQDPRSKCTVCREDQLEIKIENVPKFTVCKHFAPKVRAAVEKVTASGFEIKTVIAYRVGKSRGAIDENGLRSLFSNHSFGTAIDLNSPQNGLYKNCKTFGPNCKLSRGRPMGRAPPTFH